MELILNNHYKYDTVGRYYYLTPVGAELLTGIDDLDAVWKRVERRLKNQGKLLHEVMCLTNDETRIPRYSRRDIVEHAIYKDLNNERNDTIFMLGEMVEWAYEEDGDVITYEERNPFDFIKHLPFTIQARGRSSMLIYLGKLNYIVPEDEYQVGY